MAAKRESKRRVVLKKIGETPLQALESFRVSAGLPNDISLTYAGRLDPMAEGKLLILIGEECKKRERYDSLDKEYEFEVLFGFSSDTGDMLGLPESEPQGKGAKEPSEEELRSIARLFVGSHKLAYPAFSSKTVNGKPLFQYALEGALEGVEIPTALVSIYRAEYLGKESIERERLVEKVVQKINLLQAPADSGRLGADFRKEEILEKWKALREPKGERHVVAKFKVTVSSGTYMRALAPMIAEKLGQKGLAYSIRRTKIGRYQPIGPHFGFWKQLF